MTLLFKVCGNAHEELVMEAPTFFNGTEHWQAREETEIERQFKAAATAATAAAAAESENGGVPTVATATDRHQSKPVPFTLADRVLHHGAKVWRQGSLFL